MIYQLLHKGIITCCFWGLTQLQIFAQTPDIQQAIQYFELQKFDEGIKVLDKILVAEPNNYAALFNKAIAQNKLRQYENALTTINRALAINPNAKKAYLHRGIIYKKLWAYDKALADFNKAIIIDENYADAYFNKGLLLEYWLKPTEACQAFIKAKSLGSAIAYAKAEICENADSEKSVFKVLEQMKATSNDPTYGFTETNPIFIGTGPNGPGENEFLYLDQLRDPTTGAMIPLKYLGTCCPQQCNGKTELLRKYELKIAKNTKYIYFNICQLIEPKAINGTQIFSLKF